jgi:CRP-like cAMP-binding protein
MLEPDSSVVPEQRSRVERELFLRAMTPARPTPEVARAIAQTLKDVYLKAGEVVFRRGDPPRAAAFLVRGELVYEGVDGEDDQTFGPGSMIGILDLNIGRPRVRTAVARTDVHLLEMNYEHWLEVLEDFPDFTAAARRTVSTTLHDVNLALAPGGGFEDMAKAEADEGRSSEGSPEADLISRITMLRKTRHFEQASVHAIAQIAERGEVLRPEAGELVFRPGGSRDRWFFVMSGSVTVERRVAPELRATFGPGRIVLAGAAFSDALSSYTMMAGVKTTLLAFELIDLDDVADDHFDIVKSALRGISIDRDQLQSLRAKSEARSRKYR